MQKYGRKWELAGGKEPTPLDIELACFAVGLTKAQGGLGKAIHYRRAVSALWPKYEWNPWSEITAQALCAKNACGFTGSKDSSKSESLAIWVLTNWFADPVNTLCIVTSTDNKAAEQRVWGAIVRRYREACATLGTDIGRLIASQHIIKLDSEEHAVGDNSSISLVAAGDKYKEEALQKLQGRKNKRILLCLDELQDCSDSVVSSAMWNLKGKDYFHVSAAGNAGSIFDPHGKFCEPVNGWLSISEDSESWPIKVNGIEGICIHFDGEKSPNNELWDKQKKIKYSYLIKPEDVRSAKLELGETNPTYYRQYRGIWPPADADDTRVFTEVLIQKHHGTDPVEWVYGTKPHQIAGIDPNYTSGGDRFIFTHAEYGKALNGLWTLNIVHQYNLLRPKDRSEEEYAYVMIEEIVKLRDKLGIRNENMAVDASAGGLFWAIGERGPLKGWLNVDFAGSPSDKPLSAAEKLLNDEGEEVSPKELFVNRTTELMFALRYLLESNQLRGISPDLASEMVRRRFERRNKKLIIEGKKDYKKRMGKSPDLCDSVEIAFSLVRERYGAIAGGIAIEEQQERDREAWKNAKTKFNTMRLRRF
jgi:hypothetical protein